MDKIRYYNPHAVFLSMHVLDVGTGKRVQLPPPNDGSLLTTHLNKEHQKIMSRHLKNEVENAEFVGANALLNTIRYTTAWKNR